ncbi:unnamed protein product [Linum trigynum]|uniref:Uncharacterized protein n=1 Tax=Linum trigynum TaxID=586398 RepID=A0AAV2F933_9ROSI
MLWFLLPPSGWIRGYWFSNGLCRIRNWLRKHFILFIEQQEESELYSVAPQPPAPCIRAYPNRGPGTAMTEPRLMTKGGRPGKVKVKELAARSKNPAAWVVESDETSSDF